MVNRRDKILILKGPTPCSDKLSEQLGDLLTRCADIQTKDPQQATFIVALGDREDWPKLKKKPSPLIPVFCWLENFYDQESYDALIKRFPKIVFLHGQQGLVELTSILERSGILEVLLKSDPLAEDVFFRLKGEYLEQLEDELRDLWAPVPNSASKSKEEWQTLLRRIAGSAGTYEFETLSSVVTEILPIYDDGEPHEAAEESVKKQLKAALEKERETYAWQSEESLPTLVEIGVRQRVLVLVDDKQIANQLRFALNHSRIETVISEQPATILSLLHTVQPDILVVQQKMGYFDGIDLAAYVRRMPRFEALPILALLSENSEEALGRATRGGVDSWLTIPFSAANVTLSVLNLLQRVEVARKLGGRDALTGLYTKEAMVDRLGGDLLRVGRSGQHIAIMLIQVKETDESPRLAFMEISSAANRVFRRSDLLARYNESTLAAVLPGIDTRTILTVISRLRQLLEDSLSVEIAATIADGKATPESLISDVENRLNRVLNGVKEDAIGSYEPEKSEKATRTVPKILIADTDEAIVNLLRFFCAREGFEVEDVRTGTDTIGYLENAHQEDDLPQVLVLETFLPGVDGFQILEKVHEEYGSRIAVIMMSVNPSEERVAKAFKMGAADFVAKPFRVPEIIARIRNGLVRTCAL